MEIIFGIAILILSVVVHEVSHGYVADKLGDPTARLAGRLTLNPIPHIDVMGSVIIPALTFIAGGFIFGWAKPVPYNPYNISHKYGEAMVAGAGPLSNITLAVIFGVVIRIFGESLGPATLSLLSLIVFINILLAIFNLIPIPPLDGSKILFEFLPYKYQHVRQKLERYGFFLVLIFVIFLWQIIQPVIFGLFSLITGTSLF
jgi:Zn-dependent protease